MSLVMRMLKVPMGPGVMVAACGNWHWVMGLLVRLAVGIARRLVVVVVVALVVAWGMMGRALFAVGVAVVVLVGYVVMVLS